MRLFAFLLLLVGVCAISLTGPAFAADISVPADELEKVGKWLGVLGYMALEAWLGKTQMLKPGSVLGIVWAVVKTLVPVLDRSKSGILK